MVMDLSGLMSRYSSIVGFAIALPMTIATYYQSFKARQEVRQAREGAPQSLNCLEFVSGDGSCINLVPLETLHSLPREGDVVLLPGHGVGAQGGFSPGAYLVGERSNISTRTSRDEGEPASGGASDQGGGTGDFAQSRPECLTTCRRADAR